jgi:O-antigen ligase
VSVLVPPTVEIAGVAVFDLCIFPVLLISLVNRVHSRQFTTRFDSIETSLLLLMMLVVIAYFVNFGSEPTDLLRSLFLSSEFVYERFTIYAFLTLLFLLLIYRTSSSQWDVDTVIVRFVTVVLLSCAMNAVVTIFTWYLETGAEFGRYNFLPPLDQSQGQHNLRMIFMIMFSLSVGLVAYSGKFKKLLLLIFVLVALFSVLTVLARQTWGMLIGALSVYAFLSWKSYSNSQKLLVIIAVPMLVVSLVGIIPEDVFRSFSVLIDIFSDDIVGRQMLVENGIDIALEHFLFGVGYGHYAAYSAVPVLVNGVEKFVVTPHNGIVLIFAEFGIIGFLIFVFVCAKALANSSACISEATTKIQLEFSKVAFSILFVLVFSQLVSDSNILPLPVDRGSSQIGILVWIMIGLSAAVRKRGRPAFSKGSGVPLRE